MSKGYCYVVLSDTHGGVETRGVFLATDSASAAIREYCQALLKKDPSSSFTGMFDEPWDPETDDDVSYVDWESGDKRNKGSFWYVQEDLRE